MNVVLLISDALRAVNLGCYGYDKDTSPQIDRIAREGIRFANAFSTINSTDPSFTTIFTGQYPLTHGLRQHAGQLTEQEKSYTSTMKFLPELLHEKGLVTVGVDWMGRWHKRGYDFYAGKPNDPKGDSGVGIQVPRRSKKKKTKSYSKFDLKMWFAELPFTPSRGNWYYRLPGPMRDRVRTLYQFFNERSGKGISQRKKRPMLTDAAALSDIAIKHIRECSGKKEDFFIFVHYWDTHIPYMAVQATVKDFLRKYQYPDTPVKPILKEVSGTKAEHILRKTSRGRLPNTIGEIQAIYDGSIRYVDEHVGRIYKCLEETGVADDTLVVMTADHGESLGEHGIYFDHHGLYDRQIHVPLIMNHPSLPQGKVYQELTQHYDLVPTILDMLGMGDAGLKFDGRSLLDLVGGKSWDRRFVYAEEVANQKKRMIRDHRYKYIQSLSDEVCQMCQKHHSKGDEFYDLEQDPQEQHNIIDDPKCQEYKVELQKFVDSLDKPKAGESVSFSDEGEVMKQLEALGYI